MKKFVAVILSVLMLSGFASRAFASGCYTAKEFEAEQGLRIDSELMVIGLTCLKMPEGRDIYAKYNQFTIKNADLIGGYEETLINYYREKGDSQPEKELHTLRTNLANGISRHAIEMGVLGFCQHFTPRIDTALAMDRDTIRRWAQHVWPDATLSQPVCAKFEQ